MTTRSTGPEQRRVVDGLHVVERSGDPTRPALVIVHGGLDRSTSFGRMVRRLPEDRTVVRYDRRGYGRSEPGTAVGFERHVDDLLDLVGPRGAVVFGHSMGGTIALGAAERAPDQVRSVVTYEAPTPWLDPPGTPRWTPVDDDPAATAERFLRTMAGDRVWERLPPSTRAARRAEGPALVADLEAVATGGALVDLARVTVPVVVASGDRSASRAAAARRLAAALPRARLEVVAGADHGIHLRDPAAAARLLGAALDAVPAAGDGPPHRP